MKLLWIGDAACGSGFGRATHHILKLINEQFDLRVLGVNYMGDPHTEPYKIYPAYLGRDVLGLGRVVTLIEAIRPDIVVMQSNPWNIPLYLEKLKEAKFAGPTVGIIAVEGKNCNGRTLNGLTSAIFWTRFGQKEAVDGGMQIPSVVIPLGVDTDKYFPSDRARAREVIGIVPPEVPTDAFIVGNVNRNQSRKRIDLTIQYFAEWIKTRNIRDAYLYLHLLPGSTVRVNCDQLAGYYGVQNRLILAEPTDIFMGTPEHYLIDTYRCFNVMLNTTLGEGFGLTALEGAACGITSIAGDYAAIGEWGREGGVLLVPCPIEGVMPDVHGMIGGIPDKEACVEALDWLYSDVEARERYSAASLSLAQRPEFQWTNVAARFAEEIALVCR